MEQAHDGARRVLIVAHYASERLGGEGAIPLRLFRGLRARGVEAWLVTHDSDRAELAELLPGEQLRRVAFVPSLPGFGWVFTRGRGLPTSVRTIKWAITQLERQFAMAPVARRLVRELNIDVVHQPISVSPVLPSALTRLGAPVVMGPLNGGMDLPPAFRSRDSRPYAAVKTLRPLVSSIVHRLVRGRVEAAVVLVANERSRRLLPSGVRGRVERLPETGVVLRDWPDPVPSGSRADGEPVRFMFIGRLVDWKAVDVLLDAFALLDGDVPAELEIIGDGPQRARLERRAAELGIAGRVAFRGWFDPARCAGALGDCDVYVSPSLQESGGIAVLEAMAGARPVIAAACR